MIEATPVALRSHEVESMLARCVNWSGKTLEDMQIAADSLNVGHREVSGYRQLYRARIGIAEKAKIARLHQAMVECEYPKMRKFLLKDVAEERRGIDLHPETAAMLALCAKSMERIPADKIRSADDVIIQESRRIALEPFQEIPRLHIDPLEKMIRANRFFPDDAMLLQARYAEAAQKELQRIGESGQTLLAEMQKAGYPSSIDRAPQLFRAYRTFLDTVLVAIRYAEAARYEPKYVLERRKREQETILAEAAASAALQPAARAAAAAKADAAADALIADEKRARKAEKKKAKRSAKKIATGNAASKQTLSLDDQGYAESDTTGSDIPISPREPELREHWKRYSELVSDPNATTDAWISYLDSVTADANTEGLIRQIQGEIVRTLHVSGKRSGARKLHVWQDLIQYRAGVAIDPSYLAKSDVDAIAMPVLYLKEFTAYMDRSERRAVFTCYLDALQAALHHGMALPLHTDRATFFFSPEIRQSEDGNHAKSLVPIEKRCYDAFQDWCEFSIDRHNTGVVMRRAWRGENGEAEPISSLYSQNGFLVSISTMARIVQHAARDEGSIGHQLVISASRLLLQLREIEEPVSNKVGICRDARSLTSVEISFLIHLQPEQ